MTKPKTPLIALQGGLVLSALRKKNKKMSDDPFAWYPFAAESTPLPNDDTQERKTTLAQKNDEDNQSMSGDSVVDHDPQPRIVLPPGLMLDKTSRSSASVVSLGSWEPLDLMDLVPADSEESEDGEASTANEEDPSSSKAAKTLASDDASPPLGSRRITVSYFASHMSVVIVMLSLTFLGTKRSSVYETTSLMSIRGGATKPTITTSLAILAPGPVEDMSAKEKFAHAIGHVARTGDAIRRNLEQQVHAVDAAATIEAIKSGHHSVVSFLLNPAGQKDLPPFELMQFVDSMMLL